MTAREKMIALEQWALNLANDLNEFEMQAHRDLHDFNPRTREAQRVYDLARGAENARYALARAIDGE